jgi:hypothetical protein
MSTPATAVWRPSVARRVVLDGFFPVPRGVVPLPPSRLAWPAKDPSDVLDYELDISEALAGTRDDTITSIDVTVRPSTSGGLTAGNMAADGTVAVVWFSGGVAGTTYSVQVAVGTANGRLIGRTVLLPVRSLAGVTSSEDAALTTQAGAVITDQNGDPILLGS